MRARRGLFLRRYTSL
ncbi:hypothetical protein B4U79_09925 [Dinothrombium tinctorium]|uniref:Uncharacterized protein n=1 Tax=Dinothrombium tinctorium TaxID=1965070 RepID=A0A443Q946_9ACAR|nr:hypothetical protein B4U79_09925 [Dinothrombium tinctorium]